MSFSPKDLPTRMNFSWPGETTFSLTQNFNRPQPSSLSYDFIDRFKV